MKEITKDQIQEGMKLLVKDSLYSSFYLIFEGYNDIDEIKYKEGWILNGTRGNMLDKDRFGFLPNDKIYVLTDEENDNGSELV